MIYAKPSTKAEYDPTKLTPEYFVDSGTVGHPQGWNLKAKYASNAVAKMKIENIPNYNAASVDTDA